MSGGFDNDDNSDSGGNRSSLYKWSAFTETFNDAAPNSASGNHSADTNGRGLLLLLLYTNLTAAEKIKKSITEEVLPNHEGQLDFKLKS